MRNSAEQYWHRYNNPAKVFLSRYRALSVQMDSARRDVVRMRESLTSITAPIKDDPVQGSGTSDRMAETIAQIIDAENAFSDVVAEITALQEEILTAIRSLENETQKAVLMLRYIEGLDWISIQEKLNYERTQIFVMHGRALVGINEWLRRKGKNDESWN